MSARLALGTAQFGLDYGVNNKRGRIPPAEVTTILRYAWQSGIRVLDSAWAYQDSERLIGAFIQKEGTLFKIVSKVPDEYGKNIVKGFEASLASLRLPKIYAYLIHHFQTFIEDKNVLEDLKQLKQQGKIEKFGFSLYRTQDLEYLLANNIPFDIAQLPFSILDQRFLSFLPKLRERNIEVHARSIFLKGLMFKNPQELTDRFEKVKRKVLTLRSLAAEHRIPLLALCLNFVLNQPGIDEVIIGVDSLEHLKENVDALRFQEKVRALMLKLAELKEDDEEVIVIPNWKRPWKKS